MSKLRLKVNQGPKKGKKFNLNRDRFILGSAEEADIVIPVETVDPQHASLSFEGQRLILTDLGSQGGTFRNGQRLLGPLQVFPGDRIGLGPDVILILDGDESGLQGEQVDESELDTGMAGTEAS